MLSICLALKVLCDRRYALAGAGRVMQAWHVLYARRQLCALSGDPILKHYGSLSCRKAANGRVHRLCGTSKDDQWGRHEKTI